MNKHAEPSAGRAAARRLLVTGANGFCGSHAVTYFVSEGWQVIAGVRPGSQPFWSKPGGAPAWFGDACESGLVHIEPIDLSDSGGIRQTIAQTRPDAVLHLAGLNTAGPSWADPSGYMEVNLMGTLRLLEAVRMSDHACRIVVAGSMLGVSLQEGEVPRPAHPYSLSKSLQAAAALSWHALYGLDVIVAVPSNLIGPGPSAGLNRLLARYTSDCEQAAALGTPQPPAFRLSSATESRDFLDVRDAMRAYGLLLERGMAGQSYAMASGRMTELGELAAMYGELAATLLLLEIGSSGAPSPAAADTSALLALGWQPVYSLRQSVQDTLDDCRNGH
ncbi:NAD-dependent epimerase/dehydratase family protein [Paenibacillus pasadenensis]|uniref:NAD-dependent epimerase/dehydratase family protein n=1 Tax=Paenibacillus pasadenensis TaxID=217090 RepID=UPI00204179F2|nr:NAD-dependent epimerase/dehydratase family protein [Paenibacillus pasadenensis]MCM3746892.1 NAD-dependent epimerase/dehydratase family protein [Paenibacillus pasadenensis]